MGLVRTFARPMLGAVFVEGGVRQLLAAEQVAPVATPVTDPLRETVGDPVTDVTDTTLVRLNGAAQALGGSLLALGRAPRVASALLAGSLVPTTLAVHRFWEVDDPVVRAEQRGHFLKNVGLLGGLLLGTMDTEGEPGIRWRAGHASDHAAIAADHAKEVARLRAELAAATAGAAGAALTTKARAAAATAPARGRLVAERVGHAADLAGERAGHAKDRAELAARRAVPDAIDAGRALVGAVAGGDDED